jgi:hypothetical protein
MCAAAILASELLRTGGLHDALLGFATGLLCVILFTGFTTTEVLALRAQPRDEFQQLHLKS